MTRSPRQRFESKIYKTDSCWLWTGANDGRFGYGSFKVSGKTIKAHRFAWILEHGSIPSGMCILHKCDVPQCVNVNHLYVGTKKDNTIDRELRGRHPKTKVSVGDVIAIRSWHKSGNVMMKDIAHYYNVSPATITYILNGRTHGYI